MADKSYEKHVEDLIKVRSEIRKAAECYTKGQHEWEAYFMCRAEAVADTLNIEHDEFMLHKRIVEKEFGMEDCLLMGREVINVAKVEHVYAVVVQDGNDIDVDIYHKEKDAFAQLEKEADDSFKSGQKDVYDNTIEEAKKNGCFRLEADHDHEEIFAFVCKERVW